jgi:hypothetical protein
MAGKEKFFAPALALPLIIGCITVAHADCVTGGKSIQSFQGHQGLVLTFVRGDVSRLTVTSEQFPKLLLWSGIPFPGLTIRRPDKESKAVILSVTPDAPGCVLRIERF